MEKDKQNIDPSAKNIVGESHPEQKYIDAFKNDNLTDEIYNKFYDLAKNLAKGSDLRSIDFENVFQSTFILFSRYLKKANISSKKSLESYFSLLFNNKLKESSYFICINDEEKSLARWRSFINWATSSCNNYQSIPSFLNGDFSDKPEVKTSYFKILEVNQNSISAKVLINKEKRTFQKRRFDIAPFAEMDLKVNDFVQMSITTTPGQRLFDYKKVADDTEIKTIFEKQNHFKYFENSDLFKSLPIENEDNV